MIVRNPKAGKPKPPTIDQTLNSTLQSNEIFLLLPRVPRFKAEFDTASDYNDQLKQNLTKVVDDLNPLRVLNLFGAIPDAVRRPRCFCC